MHEPVRTYKLRRRVTTGQAEALDRLLPRFGVGDGPLGRGRPLVLEIGSGMGEATVEMAAADPARDLVAVEVHTPGLGTLLRLVEAAGLDNVRVLEGDAREVLRDRVAPASLEEVRVFFPDPWPKARHAKRRLVSAEFAELVADRLRPGGRLHVATDWAAYAAGARAAVEGCAALRVVSTERGARPVTRFERRGLAAGRHVHDLVAERI